jgi:hypothetical protein
MYDAIQRLLTWHDEQAADDDDDDVLTILLAVAEAAAASYKSEWIASRTRKTPSPH